MSVMSIRIEEKKKKKLKAIASIQGKTMSSIVEGLIDKYVEEFYEESDQADELKAIMKISEPTFNEWDNTEDDIYDDF